MSSSLVLVGIAIHIILLYSIFDIYYTSPVVQNLSAHRISNNNAPAARVVVFSADGLRWDTFHDEPSLSPFLHGLITNRKGVFGVSRSHVPTESRPGHVAIFAGFSEDVSAVAKGWKKNPVPFDSVFNRSKEAFIWGSPDITMLFDNHPHVHSFSYSEKEEDFNKNDAYKLDEWVFDRVEKYIAREAANTTRYEELKQPEKLYLLHLLGLDTNGHGKKPHSKEYKENLKFVDERIRGIVKLFNEIFPDKSTAFIFTSDHGMTDWGSHGGGSDEEILTPFLAWGAGLAKGGAMSVIEQVDLAPLMSCLLGVSIPVNSLGVLPISLLSTSPIYTFRAAYSNFQQMKELVVALRKEKSQRFFFKEFHQFGDRALKSLEAELLKLAKLGRYSAAASLFVENADLIKKAVYYYHRYDRFILGATVSLSFIGWIMLVWTFLQSDTKTFLSIETLMPNYFFLSLWIAILVSCWFCYFPWSNYIYVLLPALLLSMVENISQLTRKTIDFIRRSVSNYSTTSSVFLLVPFIGFVAISIFLFICVIIFMDRRFLSLIFILFFFVPSLYSKNPTTLYWSKVWRVCCIFLLPFPFFPNVGQQEIPSLCIIAPIIIGIALRKVTVLQTKNSKLLSITYFLTSAVIVASRFQEIFPFIRVLCWSTLPMSIVLPLFTDNLIFNRLTAFIVALYVPYSLLSIAYESFFILLFAPLLLIFVRFEFSHLSDTDFLSLKPDTTPPITQGKLTVNEFRRAVVCITFVLSVLFGTGNFASMNSFNPTTLSRFISVFSPFTMATLLIVKLLVPLLMVTLALSSVLRFERIAMHRLTYLVLILTDMMAMCFFHQLKDEGSWADIGISISQYVISMCMSVSILLLLLFSSKLMKTKLSFDFNISKRPPKNSLL